MQTKKRRRSSVLIASGAVLALVLAGILDADAARKAKGPRPAEGGEEKAAGAEDSSAGVGGLQAVRLYKRAQELIDVNEKERGLKMLETILDQYPRDPIRYKVRLALGRHYHDARDHGAAIEQLRRVEKLKKPGEEITGENKDMYVEALYLIGVSHFHMRQYSKAFSVLRRITSRYPDTVWANQAFYYIGMAHFAQEHWNKAIKALSMVGTFVDPESPLIELVEAGHRFHVKVEDKDLPLLRKMLLKKGKKIEVAVETQSGDREIIPIVPLAGRNEVFVGSMITQPGVAEPDNGTIEVVGGDKISVSYVDDNTETGEKDVSRKKTVKVVSTAAMQFTLGTFDAKAVAAFLGKPVYLKVKDVDKDVSDAKDVLTVQVAATYKAEEVEDDYDTPTMAVDIDKLLIEEEKPSVTVRDEMTVTLTEVGDGDKVHTGVFVGQAIIRRAVEDKSIDTADEVLECAMGDKVVASYTDELHGAGDVSTEITARLDVSGEIDNRPRASQDVVPDELLRAKKEVVEAEAFLELARIFNGMGLKNTATAKAETGLDKVSFTIEEEDAPIPQSLREKAYRLMWEMYLEQEEYGKAMAVCEIFSRKFPDSPLVGQALMGIAKVLQDKGDHQRAIGVLKKIIALADSFAKPEAQWRIAEIAQKTGLKGDGMTISEQAVKEYRTVAQKYPDSEFAGPALGKIVDYHIETKDYTAANELLEQIFLDYQDEKFLDSMLMKWVIVAYRTGDLQKARDKCQQLIFEHPGSKHAKKARSTLKKIQARLGQG